MCFFRLIYCVTVQKEHTPMDSYGPNFTASSEFMAAVDINRNSQHASAEVKRNDDACDCNIASDCYQLPLQCTGAKTTTSMSTYSSSGTVQCVPNGRGSDRSSPIVRPLKKRRINLSSDECTDRCVEECHANKPCIVIPPLSGADLTEWKGQRVLARSPTRSLYRPGLIRSISTSDSPIGIQFDSREEIVQTSADCVISDSAPPSSGVLVGMGVCVRTSSDGVEYQRGVVRDRLLQPPFSKFLVELTVCDGSNMSGAVWVSRASLRLLQVGRPIFTYTL